MVCIFLPAVRSTFFFNWTGGHDTQGEPWTCARAWSVSHRDRTACTFEHAEHLDVFHSIFLFEPGLAVTAA